MLNSDWSTNQKRANRTFDVAFLEDDLQLKLELKVDFFVIQFENRFRDEFSLVNSILHLNHIFNQSQSNVPHGGAILIDFSR